MFIQSTFIGKVATSIPNKSRFQCRTQEFTQWDQNGNFSDLVFGKTGAFSSQSRLEIFHFAASSQIHSSYRRRKPQQSIVRVALIEKESQKHNLSRDLFF